MSTPRKGPVPALLGRLFEPIYALEAGRRRRRFDRGVGVTRIDRPVISIGNLSVGGTGKTPMTRRVVQWLLDAGHHPSIAMRGYKAKDGHSDEAALYQQWFPDTPVIAQPDRIAGLTALFDTPEGKRVDAVVLDDGFQHRRLARDLDIVLIDATRDPFADRLLPAGWLREPASTLARAGAVVLTHAEHAGEDQIDAIIAGCRRENPNLSIAVAEHAWSWFLQTSADGADTRVDPDQMSDRRLLAVCAIGNPDAFIEQTRAFSSGHSAIVLPDHDPYEDRTIDTIIATAIEGRVDAILVTEKDWTKLRRVPAEKWPVPIVRPELSLRFLAGEEELSNKILGTADRTAPSA